MRRLVNASRLSIDHGLPYLCNEDYENQSESDPRASYAEDGLEWNLVESVAVVLPGSAVADVCKTD